MNIHGNYILKKSVVGYHWYRSGVLGRLYLIIDLVNGDEIEILTEFGNGQKVEDVSEIIKFIEE